MTITATQVLEMLTKARKLGICYDVYEGEDYGHFIQFEVNWFSDERHSSSYEKVYINSKNESAGYGIYGYDWEFEAFMNNLDDKLKEEEQKEIKAKKRKELIASLTEEQRELLGVK
jgi:hypothetical protein